MNQVELFAEQQKLINYFFNHLDHDPVQRLTDTILNYSSQGIIYLTGMGKSGIISHNISQMLVSIGIRSMFLPPVNALHGDVGVLTSSDLLLLFSRSGQTAELINLIPAVKNKQTHTVAIVSNQESKMAKMCDQTVYLPLEKELCPFDLAPTTSSIIQLILGNTIVASLMCRIGITREQYALNHPAGRIGKRLTVKVKDIMKDLTHLAICSSNQKLIDQISNMSAMKCGCLLISNDQNKLLGIFTDGDLRRTIEKYGPEGLQKTFDELINHQFWSCSEDQMAFDAMQEMERIDLVGDKKRIKEMPVLDSDGRIKGLLMLHDLVNYGL